MFYNENDKVVKVLLDQDGITLFKPGQRGKLKKEGKVDYEMPKGDSATVTVIDKDTLKLVHTGQ